LGPDDRGHRQDFGSNLKNSSVLQFFGSSVRVLVPFT
jgi:hypothetical protein